MCVVSASLSPWLCLFFVSLCPCPSVSPSFCLCLLLCPTSLCTNRLELKARIASSCQSGCIGFVVLLVGTEGDQRRGKRGGVGVAKPLVPFTVAGWLP